MCRSAPKCAQNSALKSAVDIYNSHSEPRDGLSISDMRRRSEASGELAPLPPSLLLKGVAVSLAQVDLKW